MRNLVKGGADPESAVAALMPGLLAGAQAVLLLLEAPMSVPVPGGLPGARRGLGKATAVSGTGRGRRALALATGLAQGAWVLRQLEVLVPGLAVMT